ncbi:basic helix-loop-helix ARNT-like protein 1 isoform X5 [Pseudochaenichthys georgianus]|uniref:basic helix-loop-helix ARNT-like protein 1 isoform X5 n=1 Tax=Pseudochaenichthys georgianus TaxID=52239 RepID=UPI00146C9A7D|nr:aryl hydrocarbon receptor nuclear translocator-like protein 1 isoform X5 [Pseudochaenichthys georgianus]
MRPQPPSGTPAPVCGMSAGGCDGAADWPADVSDGSSLPAVELPRKRKGDMEERNSTDCKMEDDLSRSEEEDQQVKIKCFREPHRQIEKRRRDKMNNLIDELSAMIPACQPMVQKPDKLTVLRKAVQHLKALKVGTSSAFADSTNKPSILPQDDFRQLLLRAADGFMLVVSCDRAKILFISESVSKILNFSLLELTGQSLFDFIHPKDINKVKEQLSSWEYPQEHMIDAATGLQVQTDAPIKPTHLSSGAWRSFFCRMKYSRVAGKQEEKHQLPCTAKKKDTSRYCTLHCTGYMRSCPSSQLDSEGDAETPSLSCLVMLCRPLPHGSPEPPKHINAKPSAFVTRCAIDGKFTFVEQQATTVIGYLPQEVLGTSCYEYFHQDDLQHLAEKHRQVLRSKEKIETQCYKFKTKYGSYVSLQSQWFSFTNPWTKEVEFIVSSNRVMSRGPGHIKDEEAGRLKAMQEEIPIIPSLSNGVGTMIYAGSIGTQIANELIDSYRVNSSPSSGASSPFGSTNEKCPLVSPPISTSTAAIGASVGCTKVRHSQASSGGGAASSSSQPDSRTAAGASSATADSSGQVSQLDLDGMVVPALSSFSSDEAAMAVIMSLLETEVNVGQPGDYEDLHWPF